MPHLKSFKHLCLALAALATLISLALAPAAMADGPAYAINWYRIGDQQSARSGNSQFSLSGTLLQTAPGISSNSDYVLCSGVQCAQTGAARPIRASFFPWVRRI